MREKSILIVDDSEQDTTLLRRALKKSNFSSFVDVVQDGELAIDYLTATGEFADRAGATLPVVVLLDINLPRVSGIEVLGRLRRNKLTRMLPVVMFTSSDEDCDRQQCYEIGANSYVRKPIAYQDYIDTVHRLVAYWHDINLPP